MPRFRTALSLILVFLLTVGSSRAQRVADTLGLDYRPYRGKLVAIGEMHSVRANQDVYLHVIKGMAVAMQPGDTLNLILEMPYSYAYVINEFLTTGAHANVYSAQSFFGRIKATGVPVKVFACDFEYDQKKRGSNYLLFLSSAAKSLVAAGVDVAPIKAYADSLLNERDSTWHSPRGRKGLLAWARKKIMETTSAGARQTLAQLIFVLSSKHGFHAQRDQSLYRRMHEAQAMGLVQYAGHYNLLIHGTTHLDPTWKRSLYHRLWSRTSSAFQDSAFLIQQVYLACHSAGDYFRPNTSSIVSTGPLYKYGSNLQAFCDHVNRQYPGDSASIQTVRHIPYDERVDKYRAQTLFWVIQRQTR